MTKSGLSGISALVTSGAAGVPAPVLSARAPILQASTITSDLGPDGYSWAQAKNPVVDEYGKIIVFGGPAGGNVTGWASNNEGATIVDPTLTGWQAGDHDVGTRCSLAYQPGAGSGYDGTVHALFMLKGSPTDALIYYRRWRIVRDGSHNITGYTKDATVNLVMDVVHGAEPGAEAEHPVLLWVQDDAVAEPYGKLVAMWGINQDANPVVTVTVRASMRVLTDTSADGVAANWRSLTGGSSVSATSGQKPNVATTEVYHHQAAGYQAYQAYPSAMRLPNKDLVVVWTVLGEGLYYKRLGYDATNRDWRGTASAVAAGPLITRAGTSDAGYALKREIAVEPTLDPVSGTIFVGYGEWASNARGDAWSVAAIQGDAFLGAPWPVIAYQAPDDSDCGASIFVTGDAWWDTTFHVLLVSYTDLPNKSAWVLGMSAAGTVIANPVRVIDGASGGDNAPFDIPVWLRHEFAAGKRLMLGRDFNPEARGNPPTYRFPSHTGDMRAYRGWTLGVDVS